MSTQSDVLIKSKEETKHQNKIVVFNDDVNTFEHVILCLIKYCKHSSVQAEQCTHIIHHNGKCEVKVGSIDDLLPIRSALLENHISAEIE